MTVIKELKAIDSTIGVELGQIKLARGNFFFSFYAFTNICKGELTVWDFAGQLQYTVTHQFFLSIEVLFVGFLINHSIPVAIYKFTVKSPNYTKVLNHYYSDGRVHSLF